VVVKERSRSELIQVLQERIRRLAAEQERLQALLQAPFGKGRARLIQKALRRFKAAEEKARQQLAAIQ
jgi:hypothetical protein